MIVDNKGININKLIIISLKIDLFLKEKFNLKMYQQNIHLMKIIF